MIQYKASNSVFGYVYNTKLINYAAMFVLKYCLQKLTGSPNYYVRNQILKSLDNALFY